MKNISSLFLFFFLILKSFLFSIPDLTIVGFMDPDDGIGKHSINILEALSDSVNANFVHTFPNQPIKANLPSHAQNAINNLDKSAGKVVLLTDILWDRCRTPTAFIPPGSYIKLAYSVIETTQIPKKWVSILNEEFDAVVVPDPFLITTYQNSGVTIPIFVAPLPMILESFCSREIHPSAPSTPFVFGDASANKNPSSLIKAFAKAFGNSSKVHLKMRAAHLSHETKNIICPLISELGLTNITIEEGKIPLSQLIDQLVSYDCYVNLSRGEGFSFMPREMLALGIPVIVTNNTASSTLCKTGFVKSVSSNIKGSTNSTYQIMFDENCGEQYDCTVEDAAAALFDVYNNYENYIIKARKGREWVEKYDCKNMKDLYLALIKPSHVILGQRNRIRGTTLETNSSILYEKYLKVINSLEK